RLNIVSRLIWFSCKSNKRKMPERRHCPPLDQFNAAVARRPFGKPLPAEFRPPAKPARHGSERFFEHRPQPGLGTEMVHQNDFAAGPDDAGKFIKRRFRIGHSGDHVLRDDHIEASFRKGEMLRIHDGEPVDIAEPPLPDSRFGFAQHRRRQIDTDQGGAAGVWGQRYPGAAAVCEEAAADAFRRRDRRFAPALEHGAEYEVVDRRPASVSFGDYGFVELIGHWRDWCTAALPGPRWRRQSCELLMRLSMSFSGSECFRGRGYC